MKRITFTVIENSALVRLCADEEVEIYIVDPSCPRDRVYRCSSLRVGPDQVAGEIDGWPVDDFWHAPVRH